MSERIYRIASYVRAGSIVYDLGCDHGLIGLRAWDCGLSKELHFVDQSHEALQGLYHVSADAIDKHSLLHLLDDAFDGNVRITGRDELRIDRSLDSTRFRAATGLIPAPWPAMIAAMAADATDYDMVRRHQGDGH